MLALPPTDPRNWYRNAFMHLLDCPHQNWWFLPWHRAYLVWFERTYRQLSGDQNFALPYWDWTKNPRVPTAMFDGVLGPNDPHFIASFDQFQSAFQAPVDVLYASFSQAQQNVVTQRNLSASSDFLSAAQQMFFNQPNARGLTAANPDLDATTQSTVAIGVVRSALEDFPFAGDVAGGGAPGFASANAARRLACSPPSARSLAAAHPPPFRCRNLASSTTVCSCASSSLSRTLHRARRVPGKSSR